MQRLTSPPNFRGGGVADPYDPWFSRALEQRGTMAAFCTHYRQRIQLLFAVDVLVNFTTQAH